MITLNKRGYDPIDDDNVEGSGFRRPPNDPACICDYFAVLMEIEDGGEFLHKEMAEMLKNQDAFFVNFPLDTVWVSKGGKAIICPDCREGAIKSNFTPMRLNDAMFIFGQNRCSNCCINFYNGQGKTG